jgi:hypothetical protein
MTRQQKELAHMDSLSSDAVPATAGKNEVVPTIARAVRQIVLRHHPYFSSLDIPVLEDAADEVERLTRERDDLLAALKRTERLCQQLCMVAMNSRVHDHLPFGVLDDVKDWLSRSDAYAAIAKAEGR